jgi:hypothetical protein
MGSDVAIAWQVAAPVPRLAAVRQRLERGAAAPDCLPTAKQGARGLNGVRPAKLADRPSASANPSSFLSGC